MSPGASFNSTNQGPVCIMACNGPSRSCHHFSKYVIGLSWYSTGPAASLHYAPLASSFAWQPFFSAASSPIQEQNSFNPLTTEFFPPRQHIFMHSAHTTFVGTPLPQHSLLSGQTWWGPHTWRDPSGNTVNDIHDPHKASNRRSKVDVSRIFAQHFPKLGPDLTDGTPYTTNLQVFLRPWVGSMNIIRIKNPRVNESH